MHGIDHLAGGGSQEVEVGGSRLLSGAFEDVAHMVNDSARAGHEADNAGGSAGTVEADVELPPKHAASRLMILVADAVAFGLDLSKAVLSFSMPEEDYYAPVDSTTQVFAPGKLSFAFFARWTGEAAGWGPRATELMSGLHAPQRETPWTNPGRSSEGVNKV